jgi:uncharacterized protein YoxC
MSYLEVSVTILIVAFLVFVFFSIPSLLQIRKTAEEIAVTLRALNESLPGILRNLERITANVNDATATVNREVEDLSNSFRKLQRSILFLSDMGRVVQNGARVPLLNTITTMGAVVKGVRAFVSVMSEKNDRPGRPPKK